MKKDIFKFGILEFLFNSELPGPQNKHQTPHDPQIKGPSNFPYYDETGEAMSENEIDAELSELKLGPVMTDPLNLPMHNLHDGGDGWGKASRPFGNFKTKNKLHDPSGEEVVVRSIAIEENPIENEEDPVLELEESLWNHKKSTDKKDIKITDKLSLFDILNASYSPEKEEEVRKKLTSEEIGAREKALHKGDPALTTTKQPFANGLPKATDMSFMDEDEIMRELGIGKSILEWISSSSIFNNHISPEEAEEDFFDGETNNFLLNSEEDFNENQRKLNKVKNEKQKK